MECPMCEGKKRIQGGTCPACKDTGTVKKCPSCDGTGLDDIPVFNSGCSEGGYEGHCTRCSGTGHISFRE